MAQTKTQKLFSNYLQQHTSGHQIANPPNHNIGLIVVIPAYREDQLLLTTLSSLCACLDPGIGVEVIVVVNSSANDSPRLQEKQVACQKLVQTFAAQNRLPWLQIYALPAYHLRPKHFGAGLARKIGLDEAVRRFSLLENPEGILACLDADSPVAPNYLKAIAEWFSNPNHKGATINFEHPLEGDNFPAQVYEAITFYELHLRYYVQALRQTGFPYAFHTIGSTMVFRTENYIQAGGMPKKQAGEDFYFLQKLIPLGGFGEIWTTTVTPSPRPSDRVIFGTGAAIKQHLSGEHPQGETYPLQAFDDLSELFKNVSTLWNLPIKDFEAWSYTLPGPLRSFLLSTNFTVDLEILQNNSSTSQSFEKRFYALFNAFKVVKYLNYSQAHFYAPMSVLEAASTLLERLNYTAADFDSIKSLTQLYRKFEREHPYEIKKRQ